MEEMVKEEKMKKTKDQLMKMMTHRLQLDSCQPITSILIP
jgi:hypothetical protein